MDASIVAQERKPSANIFSRYHLLKYMLNFSKSINYSSSLTTCSRQPIENRSTSSLQSHRSLLRSVLLVARYRNHFPRSLQFGCPIERVHSFLRNYRKKGRSIEFHYIRYSLRTRMDYDSDSSEVSRRSSLFLSLSPFTYVYIRT